MNICVFGSSSEQIDKIFLETAENLGKTIAKRGDTMIFGAGEYGVMGAAARGVVSEKGELIGVAPHFFDKLDVIYDKCTELIYTATMRERKGIMEERSDAFVVCAGGMGTFEEFFEVLTLKQLGCHTKPIIIYNVNGYYNPMLKMMQAAVEQQFMSDDCHNLYSVADTEEQVFEQIENYKAFTYNKYSFLMDGKEETNG